MASERSSGATTVRNVARADAVGVRETGIIADLLPEFGADACVRH
jgi:hypothetical protein